MKTAVIVHGMPSKEEYFNSTNPRQSEDHWLLWLKNELIGRDIAVHVPEMPTPYAPNYEKWKAVMDGLAVDAGTALIGHSCGAGFLVRWLSENKIDVDKVALVAPFLDPDHDEVSQDFFDFNIDSGMAAHTKGIVIFVSPEDDREILESVALIAKKIPEAKIISLPGHGHFTIDSMKTNEFTELLHFLVG